MPVTSDRPRHLALFAAVTLAGCGTATISPSVPLSSPTATRAVRATNPRFTPSKALGAVRAAPRATLGSCHTRGTGLYALPDPICTPGAINPAVTPANISSTICKAGWTATVRPPESVTEPEKLASMRAYGITGSAHDYEFDHLVPLELGGAANMTANLWPELDYANHSGYYANPKDRVERALNRLVCDGRMSLVGAQQAIAADWVAAYRRYVR